MAKLTFDAEDRRTLKQLSEEFDPATHQSLKDFADTMPADDWRFTCTYMRLRLGETIVGCLCARAYLGALIERGMLTEAGLKEFFTGSVDGAQRNFGTLDGPEDHELERRYVDILIAQQRKVYDEDGAVRSAELGELFSRIQYEVEERLLGDLAPEGRPEWPRWQAH